MSNKAYVKYLHANRTVVFIGKVNPGGRLYNIIIISKVLRRQPLYVVVVFAHYALYTLAQRIPIKQNSSLVRSYT